MASSGTEAHWAGPGLGQGPRRRRWAWAEEQDADGSSDQGWGNQQSLPKATSPELLEDFRRAQECPLPLEWDPGMQESEESSGEETEADDGSSPEGSPLPLPWLSRHTQQLDLSEEELDAAPGSPEAELAEESYTELECEDPGSSSPGALEQGPAGDWVASIKQGSKHRPEHPTRQPSVEHSPTKTWSSGTVSLGQPSDSLDSTWEGDADVPQPATLTEALPHSPRHSLPQPDDRNGDGVAPATPTEFRDSLAAPAQNPQCSAGTWGRETTSLPGSQPENRAWRRTKTSPKPLPSRFTGSISPPSTRLGAVKKVVSQHNQGVTLAGHSSSDAPKYGRGRLNYPLPDFSKVGPRVKFPKDENYRPPKSRGHNRQQGPARPLIFKSPAEIVREVLMSNGERPLVRDPSLAQPITRVPQEFQTPEQATELVHQLQEDYHKLLTKYAEAENTIDQLRLGAKVHLYSDPPQPNQSICSGTMPQGSKVLSFSVPQPRSAEWWPGPARNPQASEATGWSSPRADLSPPSSPSMATPRRLPQSPGVAADQPSTGQTRALTSQASQLLAKVESFEELVLTGHLPPQDQIKSLEQLRAAHGALEAEYLEACKKRHLNPKPDASTGSPRTLNLCRELEAEICRLGQRLEELQDHMDQTQREPASCSPDLPGNAPATPFLSRPAHVARPSGSVSSPAVHTFHEPAATATSPRSSCVCPTNKEVSPGSIKAEESPRELPAPLRDRELQMEQDFHGLLEQYLSVKSLPEALRVEDEEGLKEKEELDHLGTLESDGPATAPGEVEATRVPSGQRPAQAEEGHRAASQEEEEQAVSMQPPSSRTSMARDRYAPGLGAAEVTRRGTKPMASHQSSLTSLEENGPTELLPRKALLRAGAAHTEEPWMASPETDSGFVGSETSIVSPFTQTPEHRLTHVSAPGTSAQHLTASAPGDGASHPKARGSVMPRRSTEAATPRSRAQQRLSRPSSSLRQGAHSSQLGQAPVVTMRLPRSEFKRQKQISKQLRPSGATSPASDPAPTAASVSHGSAESTASLLLTRTERDQAIRDLQAEVSQLRLRLEDSLHRPHPGSPTHAASAFQHSTRTQDKLMESSPSWGSHYGSKSTERLSEEPNGPEPAVPTGRRRARSSSVPRDVPRLFLSSESESLSPRLSSERNRTFEERPQAAQEGTRSSVSLRQKERVSFRGQYTGQEYHILSPKAVLKDRGTASCPHCQPIRTQDAGSAVPREPPGPSSADTLRCPLCGIVRSTAEADGPSSGPSEKKTPRKTAPSTPSPKRKSRHMGSPVRPLPGLWYLPAAPPVPAPPALAYISSAPGTPYPPPTVYYATPAPTSARTASPQPAQGPRGTRHSVHLGLSDLEELQAALSEAAQAAENVCSTTRQLSRSLSADLRHARSLRGSCLF
ncbi:microtubule organization protein AKNA isoform X3 [Mesocricetus auratus]|uniref:Microtubule organization protein AKNA isoform X3 n=1 Tax=Mesocricetus auratus TaxID=10036 RepID=A0A3Q0CYD0_MESAU|nr:microtubule organization protein AKNA isoform X3 [Mesocricetus auratus]